MLSNSQSSKSRPRLLNAGRMLHRSKLPAATQWWFRTSLKGEGAQALPRRRPRIAPKKLGLSRLMCSIRSSLSPSSKTAGGDREGREETSHGLSRSCLVTSSQCIASSSVPSPYGCASYEEESKPALRGSSLVLLVHRVDRVQTAKSVGFRGARSKSDHKPV